MSDAQLEPLEKPNPRLATMPRYKVAELVETHIAHTIDMVLARDGVELAQGSRDEIVCVAATDIVNNVITDFYAFDDDEEDDAVDREIRDLVERD